ncbi:MAG: hypothetical protein PHF18_11070 [Methanosarcina sp.]|uniref:hypothetical protein n=1 Tax=Methanosarcina sp. TaxID=2213 RepID=UPI002609A9C2|nr:hypothetical protein [Methanosarcina sp.]MDD3247369.1 hypothetical protein [Methanosarcina sp.]
MSGTPLFIFDCASFFIFISGFPKCPTKPKNSKIVKIGNPVKIQDSTAKNIIQSMILNIIISIILYTGNAFQIDIYLLLNLVTLLPRTEWMKE